MTTKETWISFALIESREGANAIAAATTRLSVLSAVLISTFIHLVSVCLPPSIVLSAGYIMVNKGDKIFVFMILTLVVDGNG